MSLEHARGVFIETAGISKIIVEQVSWAADRKQKKGQPSGDDGFVLKCCWENFAPADIKEAKIAICNTAKPSRLLLDINIPILLWFVARKSEKAD